VDGREEGRGREGAGGEKVWCCEGGRRVECYALFTEDATISQSEKKVVEQGAKAGTTTHTGIVKETLSLQVGKKRTGVEVPKHRSINPKRILLILQYLLSRHTLVIIQSLILQHGIPVLFPGRFRSSGLSCRGRVLPFLRIGRCDVVSFEHLPGVDGGATATGHRWRREALVVMMSVERVDLGLRAR